jgi:hypothetical protein
VVVCLGLWRADKSHDDGSGEVVRGEGEPSEDDLGHIIDELNVQEEQSDNTMAGAIEPTEVHNRVQGSCKGPVEPPSSLPNEFGCAFGNVSLAFRCFHVRKVPKQIRFIQSITMSVEQYTPALPGFRYKLEA